MCWNKHSSQMSLIRSIFLYLVCAFFVGLRETLLFSIHLSLCIRTAHTLFRLRMSAPFGISGYLYFVDIWKHPPRYFFVFCKRLAVMIDFMAGARKDTRGHSEAHCS